MQTIFIGFKEDQVSVALKSIGIRTCYLFSKQFLMAGSIHHFFYFEQIFKEMKTADQLKFLIENSDLLETGMLEVLQRIKKLFKEAKNIRADRKTISEQRRLEKLIQQLFDNAVWSHTQTIRETGLLGLKDLVNKPTVGFYNIDYRSPEQKMAKDDSLLSDILQLDLDEEDISKPTFLFISPNLFNEVFLKETRQIITIGEYSEKGFLVDVLSISNYFLLSVAQMDALRTELAEPLHRFHEMVGKFAAMLDDTAVAFDFLQYVVKPAAAELQQAHDNSTVINGFNAAFLKDAMEAKLYLGFLPSDLLYHYYRSNGTLCEKTEKVLQEANTGSKFFPVLVMGKPSLNIPVLDKEKISQPAAQIFRKTITLD